MQASTEKLSISDLCKLDEERLRMLPYDQLQEVSVNLLHEFKVAVDRLHQTPQNSSVPSSSMPPWATLTKLAAAAKLLAQSPAQPVAEKADTPPESTDPLPATDGAARSSSNTPSGKPAGRQRNSQGFGRTEKLAVTDTQHHHPTHCDVCGEPLDADCAPKVTTSWIEIDIAEQVEGQPALRFKVTEHLMYSHICTNGHTTRAKHFVAPDDPLWEKVAVGEWRLVGPMLAALIVYMALSMRLSRARIRCFFADIMGLKLSIGVINNTILEAGRAIEPLEDELVKEIEAAALVHIDETPWKEAGQLLWMWAFVTQYTKLFLIGNRTLEILDNLLGHDFKGTVMSDGYLAYRHFINRLRCWAHLLRKTQGLIDSADARVAGIGQAMHDSFCNLMEIIYVAREAPKQAGPPMADKTAAEIEKLRWLCEQNRDHKHDKLRALTREFLLDWEVILRQVREPHLPLTNNFAEQILRHWVIARKLSQGTRSYAGTRALGILASVIDTCNARSASSWRFIGKAIAAARVGATLPTLPVIPVGE
jgi:hypothetical protein